MGQYDILIMLHTGYTQKPPALKEIQTVINFDIPQSYASYKESGGMVSSTNGAVFTLVEPDLNITDKQKQNQTQDLETLAKIMHKMDKNLGRSDMMKCIPVMWNMICKFKSRVESVFLSLSNKQVAREKMLEFKKQLVSNKGLREYFDGNPQEKEILLNDIQKGTKHRIDIILFKSLDIIPSYLIPEGILAITQEQFDFTTIGSQQTLGSNMSGSVT